MTFYDDLNLKALIPAQAEIVMLGTVVHALWSLQLELMLDIDVYTPEGMNIPARQRFTQVMQMMQYFENEYSSKAGLMGMGLEALTQFRLRRVAYTTNRFVPVYKDREVNAPRPPERIYPPIPEGGPQSQAVDVIEDIIGVRAIDSHTVEEIAYEGQGLGFGGWYPIGTRG
jgi:hypothetical protein